MATDSVKQTLELLQGMQKLRLVAQSVEITEAGIKVDNITLWDPPSLDRRVPHNDVLDGHGEPPDV